MSNAVACPDPLVVLHDVHRTYGSGSGAVEAVRGVSLAFEAGALHAILGPSGSGKSTLLHLASGLDIPTRGTVRLLGHDVSALGDDDLARLRRRSVGFVFQFFNLVPTLTVEENALLPILLDRAPTREDRARLDRLLASMEIASKSRRLPEELSGGERQRAAIVRAMMPSPPVVFADEPTGNLDSETGERIVGHLCDLVTRDGTCLVIVTHEPRIAERADQVVRLKDGRVVEQTGSPLNRRARLS
jgi:putative ABC transport system ATP-binding protein